MRPIAVSLNSLFVALVLVTAASAAEQNPARTPPGAAAEQASAQRIIVKFRQSTSLSTQAAKGGESAAAAGAANTGRMNALANRARITVHGSKALGGDMHVMQVSPVNGGETAAETLARLRSDSDVEFAELDRRVYLHSTDSNDPRYVLNTASDAGQWYLREVLPSAINARGAWDITKGSNGVVIAVVDTGVLYNHEDLMPAGAGGKLLPGYDFISPDANNVFTTAGDGNGPDGDPSDPGDFCRGDGSSWHGTRVSGIISARTNNNIGVSGINWNGYILPVRVIGRCGGFNSDVVAGIRWAAGLSVPNTPANPYPAQVINVSLGGTGSCDAASASAISAATAAGALVVVSAGNEGGPVDSPANCPGAMAVLGLRHAGTKVGFSSLGSEIALGAPGGNCVNDTITNPSLPCVYSIDTSTNTGNTAPGANSYTDKNSANTNVGTSFSSPIVSGIAGLMLSVNGNLNSKQLIARMREGASPYPTTSDTVGTVPQCQDPFVIQRLQGEECICNTAVCGAGMANALGAVTAALRPIAAVSFPPNYAAGSSVTLDGSGSGAACNRSVSTYSWSVGGTVVQTGPSYTLTAPANGGTATVVRLTVTDDAGKTDFAEITVGPTSALTTAPTSAGAKACLTDISPPSAVSITATDASAAEGGTDTGVFTITRAGSTAAALTVTLAFSGSATNGTDYLGLNTTVTIPAGSASTTLTVTPVDDSLVDGAETAIATLQAGAGYQVGDPSSATVTIADNDTAAAPPPAEGKSGGGGGAVDLLTLIGMLAFAVIAMRRRRLSQ
jgi:serine protease